MERTFDKVVGCGGIGKGMLFLSPVMETWGRSESRLVYLSDAKDYCKLQIVFYYLAAMRGPATYTVYPIGAVGADANGEEMRRQMQEIGMDTSYVAVDPDNPTMLSICMQYPDKEGGNFTTINSAAAAVTPDDIVRATRAIGLDAHSMVVALPEVSPLCRKALLAEGRAAGSFCAASVTESEAEEFAKEDIYALMDLISVNEEEARAICVAAAKDGTNATEESAMLMDLSDEDLFANTLSVLRRSNPSITLMMTVGGDGAFVGDETHMEKIAPYPAKVVNTTGAGDAFVGTTLAMMARGVDLFHEEGAALCKKKTAPEIGTIAAGLAVESEDSIPFDVTLERVEDLL